MKKLMLLLMLVLMSMTASVQAAAQSSKSQSGSALPTNIIIKQTTQFDDGRTLVLFYKKQGNQCEVYSTSDVKSYSEADLRHVKSTNVEIADHTEGKLVRRATLAEVRRLVKQLVNRFL